MDVKIEPFIVSYKELKENSFVLPDDKYGIAKYVLTDSRKKALINCPFIEDENTCALYFVTVDGIIAGRETYFTSKMKICDEVLTVEAASAFEVEEKFRHYAVGADILMATFTRSKLFVGAGVSQMALPLDRKLKFHVLEFPRLMLLKNSRALLDAKHLSWMTSGVNCILRLINNVAVHNASKLERQYQIEKVAVIPEWVDEIVLNDGHKYAEYHNHEWLQWNLDYNFRGESRDKQSFYCVYNGSAPLGFFMIKERFREKAGGVLNNVLVGSIVEWGTRDEKLLNERDLALLSLKRFSKDVDIIETATSDINTVSSLRRVGFMQHGNANIVFKDRTKQYKDASDINLWRIRFGYGDVILT